MSTGWWEIQVLGLAELEENVFWRLQSWGCQGSSSQAQADLCQICGYLPQQQVHPAELKILAQELQEDAESLGLAPPTVTWQQIDEQDWATSWQQYWHPQEIGERLLIYPAWLELPETTDRLILRLNPGVAFGTGTHATTQLCLRALEMRFDPQLGSVGQTFVADIGCGSGILSLAAVLLGARKVYAVDNDPLAVGSTASSLALNQISPTQVQVSEGSAGDIPEPVDGIVCNILAGVIIELLPQISQIAKPGSWAIFSGLLNSQSQQVCQALEQQGWQVSSLWRQEDWCCVNAQRPTVSPGYRLS